MNGILRLKHIQDYKKVSYYSVCIDNEDLPIEDVKSLFELFVIKQTKENKDKLNHILAWLQEIGDKYGASEDYFRNEQKLGEAMGLPPYKISKEPTYTEDGEVTPNNLRLYCHRLNNSVVILLSGDLKTADTAQKCLNVKPHFELANQLTLSIDNAFKEKEIFWIYDDTDIDYPDDLILYY